MAAWAALAGGLDAGANAYNAVLNMRGQKEQNLANWTAMEAQMAYNKKMYGAEVKNNLMMWNLNNAYNDPRAQMKRLKAAGLNPHLIYGSGASGASGGSGSPAHAGDVKGIAPAQAESVYKGVRAFDRFSEVRMMALQSDNIKAQTEVAQQEAIRKAYETLDISLGMDRKAFDLGLAKDLRNFSVDAARGNAELAVNNARRAYHDANVAGGTEGSRIQAQELENAVKSSGLKVNDWRIKEIQARVRKLGQDMQEQVIRMQGMRWDNQSKMWKAFEGHLDNSLKRLELDMAKKGVYKSDNLVLRMFYTEPKVREALGGLVEYAPLLLGGPAAVGGIKALGKGFGAANKAYKNYKWNRRFKRTWNNESWKKP